MILTNLHRYKDAIRFKRDSGNKCWMVLGGTSAWLNEAAPPAPSVSATSVAGAFCAVKATVAWIQEDDEGSIVFIDAMGEERRFSELVTEEDVIEAQSSLLLIRAQVSGAILGVSSFRIVGIYTDLIPEEDHEEDTFLTMDQINQIGQLESLQNRKAWSVFSEATYRLQEIFQY